VVQALPTEGDRCCCRVGSRIIQHTRTPVSELLAPSPHHLRRHDVRTITSTRCLWMLAGTHYSVIMFLTQHCTGTACAMVIRPITNEEGCLWTQNTVTPHQFYAVPGNKTGKLFRLSYVNQTILIEPNSAKTRFTDGDEQMQDIGNVYKHELLIIQRDSV
jgi:hypothetical protein